MSVTSSAMKKQHKPRDDYWHPRGYRDKTLCGQFALTQSEVDTYQAERNLKPIVIEDLPECRHCF